MFRTDSYFHIGYAHLMNGQPCQDYALSGMHTEAAYAIVADGCSTGGHTDVGARVLTLATAQAIREYRNNRHTADTPTDAIVLEVAVRQRATIASVETVLGLRTEDLQATCVYVYLTNEVGFVHLAGDGVVAFVGRDGCIRMLRYDWADNMPFYPVYALSNAADFITAHGGDPSQEKLFCEERLFNPQNGFSEASRRAHSLEEGIRGLTLTVNPGTLDYVAIFSDGVTQVDEVDWKDAVVSLLGFKTTAGAFAKRRCIRFIKDARRDSRGPLDDLSYAVVKVTHEETQEVQPCS